MSGPGGGANGGGRMPGPRRVRAPQKRLINIANPQEALAALEELSEIARVLRKENAELTAQRTSALKVIAWLVEEYGDFEDGVGSLVVSHSNATKSNEHVLLHGEPTYEDDGTTVRGQEITITTRMATKAERAAASTSTQRAGLEQPEPSRIITPSGFDFAGYKGPAGGKPH